MSTTRRDDMRGYPNYHKMQQAREIKVKLADNICEKCKVAPAMQLHHLDCKKDNHGLDNLLILCIKCHKEIHRLSNKRRTKVYQIRLTPKELIVLKLMADSAGMPVSRYIRTKIFPL